MAKYITGTVDVTNGSATVTGNGTAWDASMVGAQFKIDSIITTYIVMAFVSPTEITLSAVYAGSTDVAVAYSVTSDFTLNYDFLEIAAGNREWNHFLTQTIRLIDAKLKEVEDRIDALGTSPDAIHAGDGTTVIHAGDGTTEIEIGGS